MVVAPLRFVSAALAACFFAGCASAAEATHPAAAAPDTQQISETEAATPDQSASAVNDTAANAAAA